MHHGLSGFVLDNHSNRLPTAGDTPHRHIPQHPLHVCCRGLKGTVEARQARHASCRAAYGTNGNGAFKKAVAGAKAYDVVGLSNLCVDVVVPLEQLPPAKDPCLLQQLTAHPPSEESWELGGGCNFMIAAARMGMKVGSIGHVGNDVYGEFMHRVLQAERIEATHRLMPSSLRGSDLDKTLLCFVLVDPHGKHDFCSRYDFGPWPLLAGVSTLPTSVTQVLQSTAAVFTNGYVFDELPLELVKTAIHTASTAGAAILFDPGPRAFTMRTGSRRMALDTLMDLSDVVLMTEEEAVEVTGLHDPQAAAEAVLSRPGARTEWCVVKLGAEGALLVTRSPQQQIYQAGAFQVEVQDTVGCGDSFAAAIVLGYTRTHDVHATLLLANAVGAATAMGRGAGTNVANAPTVLSILNSARSSASVDGVVNTHDLDKALHILHDSLSSIEQDRYSSSISKQQREKTRSPAHAA